MKKHEHNEVKEVSWAAMMGLLGARLAVLTGFLIFLSFILAKDGMAFYAMMAFAYIITIPYSLWMRSQDRMRRLAPLQFLVDLVLVSGLVYFTGGLNSDLTLLYPLIILSAGIVLPLAQTIQITALSIISYVLIVLMMSQNMLVQYPSVAPTETLSPVASSMILRIFIFIFFGITSAYVSSRCDYINKKEKQFGTLAEIIFKNVKTGLLLLDDDDHILMANDRAGELLGWNETELVGKALYTLEANPSADTADEALPKAAHYFRRSDGSVLPVSIESARLTLPAEALPNAPAPAHTLVNTRVLSFSDLSRLLHLQSQTSQLERVKSAAHMAKEMAHRVRTPLTSISGAVQLLQLTLKEGGSSDIEKGQREQDEFCHQIVTESGRMDEVIQSFLNYADFSPQDARELIRMDVDQEIKKCSA